MSVAVGVLRRRRRRAILGGWLGYGLLGVSVLPILVGYAWLGIASFSRRTQGLIPTTIDGRAGGWTLDNWSFLFDGSVYRATVNSLLMALGMVVGVGFVSTLGGYAISRIRFPGRKGVLSMTLLLNAFRADMLLIAIFFVLRELGTIPGLGRFIGFDTVGGVALVMVSLELPLGLWLMKGFFDSVSWDMERAALIDGASRFRAWWEIVLPQVTPGLAALSVFTFISGWNAYLIPFTYTVGTGVSNLPVYLNELIGETAPTNWNQVAAVGLFQLLPILAFYLVMQEKLLNIYSGGTKGGT